MSDGTLSDRTLRYGEGAIRALLGLDALYRAESGDEDGLAVLDMSAGQYTGDSYSSYDEARSQFEELRAESESLDEPDRSVYYRDMCNSSLSFMKWRQGQLDFESQLSRFLHVPASPASEQELDGIRSEMRSLLTTMGFTGDLPQQASAWESKVCVPADEVQGTIDRLMDQAWERTGAVMEIPAERSDGMKVQTVRGQAFNARCNYRIRTVELNIDPVLTLPGLRHLVVHEGYPGHYVQFKMREVRHREGRAAADGLLSVVNTASSSTFEGIADNGMAVIGWDQTNDDRLQMLMNRYRAGIGTVAAWQLHAQKKPEAQVADWLRNASFVGGDGWVDNRMKFLAAPPRAVLIWSYWWGESVVNKAWNAIPRAKQSAFLEFLYGRMHSNASVAMFES